MHYRTFFLGFYLLIFFLGVCYKKFTFRPIYFFFTTFILFVSLIFLNFQSTCGRLFIFKISFKIWLENIYWGIYPLKFNVAFNHAQANWFYQNGLYSKSAFLANDGYFALNEWLQIGVEFGFLGFFPALFITIWLVFLYFQHIRDRKRGLSTICLALLLPIIIACFFSYPLRLWYFQLITFVLLILILYCQFSFFKTIQWRLFFSFLIVSFVTVCGFERIKKYRLEKSYVEIVEEWQDGYKSSSILKLSSLVPKMKDDYYASKTLAIWYYKTDNIVQAINTLEQHHYFECNQSNHSLLGNWYLEIEDSVNSEKHYFLSLYITPHLLQSRINLMRFYDHYKNYSKSIYWAYEVIACPIKVKTTMAYALKDSALNYITNRYH